MREFISIPPAGPKREVDGTEKEETEEEKARKKARMAPLHREHVAPISFITGAVESRDTTEFNITGVGKSFGNNHEAFARECYEELATEIYERRSKDLSNERNASLFVIAGSSGVGKSTFLAYFVARMKNVFKNVALCYASKSPKTRWGTPVQDETECIVWLNNKLQFQGIYAHVKGQLKDAQNKLDLILMDGCSMHFVNTEMFHGTIVIAASPSLYVKNLQDAIFMHRTLIMPGCDESEGLKIAEMLGVEEETVKENFSYMNGIARYLFKPGAAQGKVTSAVKEVSASSITKMLSMQASTSAEQSVAVHSLVLWKRGEKYTDSPRFELVSKYAEQLVAKKLALETKEQLKTARLNMAPLSGAEGYAGALFKAYAIRALCDGGTFDMRSLEDASKSESIQFPLMTSEPVVVETNKLTAAKVPYDRVRVPVPNNGTTQDQFYPRLLWPTTTNFPTFDCFYFGTDGRVFPLQMTIAKKHDLKNSGAANAKLYLDGLLGKGRPTKYAAVFTVPGSEYQRYQKQTFTGDVSSKKSANYGSNFEQWVLKIP